jgi:hypothetical protein
LLAELKPVAAEAVELALAAGSAAEEGEEEEEEGLLSAMAADGWA